MGAIQQVLASYGASFSPLDNARLSEWWSITSLAAVGDGNPISSWVGEKGVYTLESTGTARATYDADDGDGIPAVSLDGVDDKFTEIIDNFDLYGSTGDCEIWFVLKGLSVGAGTKDIYQTGGITQSMAATAQTNPRVLFYTPGGVLGISGAADLQDDAWHILRLVKNGNDRSFYVDGVFISTAVVVNGGWTDGPDQMDLGVGTNGLYWHGGMRHALFFTAPLDAAEALAITGYLEDFI